MNTLLHKFIVSSLVIAIFASSPKFLLAQQKLLGELVITKASSEGFVTVNGGSVLSGRSIASPSSILTSPQASAKVSIAKTGIVLISPNSKLNLYFKDASIAMDIVSGEVTIETVPNTSLNIFLPDGNLTLPIENQSNTIKVKVDSGKTQVQTLVGQAKFNNVLVSAGEIYPLTSTTTSNKPIATDDDNSGNSRGFNPLLLIGLLGGAAAIAIVVLAGSSGNNDSPPVLSPTR